MPKSACKNEKAVSECHALTHQKVHTMARTYQPKTNLARLQYSPTINPLIQPQTVELKRRYVRSSNSHTVVNMETGEIHGIAAIHQIEEKDDAEFVKIFADGVAASYELTKTAQNVFRVVLDQYQKTPMSNGYADYVNLFWFDDGIDGKTLNMSEYTFKRGLRELIDKTFLWPKDSASFWVNPALMFKGNRAVFIKEYRRKISGQEKRNQKALNQKTKE
jgi:hypothetical protein